MLSYIDLQQKYFPSSWQSFQSSHHSGAIQPPMKIYKYLSMIWIWSNLNEPPKLHCLGQQAKDIQEAFEHCLSLFPPLKIAQYLRNANKMFHTCRADTRRLTILGLSWLKLVCWCLTRFILAKKTSKKYYTNLPPSEGPRSLMGMLAKWRGSARMDSSRWIAHLCKEKTDEDKVGSGLAWLPPEVSAADVSLAQFYLSLRQHWKKK